ncbi:S8 family serine peptidase [Dactylosporangium sp. AC04546]|uniref:S8 family serine peptidase n=1 Tax=Dactylosporangium sp. AC04546 TaxID=2862460 RepID=UPI002E7B7FB7|nr:S8 family serine peptidase [Dactylosporangium sp. AC04546]WVK89090.1 S8 family serine peptidase [Dactylosporangium sp. AC04546]
MKPPAKPPIKTPAMSAANPPTNPAANPPTNPAIKPAVNPPTNPPTNPAIKPPAKPAVKPSGRPRAAVLLAMALAAGLPCWPAAPATAAPRVPPANRSCPAELPAPPQPVVAPLATEAAGAWPFATGRGVVVAVVDTGVDARHPQLGGAVLAGADLLYAGGGPGNWDCDGHGTGMAALIAGRPRAGGGPAGIAPGARILPVAVSERGAAPGELAPGREPALAAAIRYAVANGARVVNVSLVTYTDDPAVRAAVATALAAGCVVVAATGDGYDDAQAPNRTPYPAAYPGVIGVGAIDAGGTRLASSAVGPYVDLVAPGDGLSGADSGGGYTTYTGTGAAAATVSGTVALLLEHATGWTAEDVARRLFATAGPSLGGRPAGGPSPAYGHGVVDPYRAVTEPTGPGRTAGPPAALTAGTPDAAALAAAARRERMRRRAAVLAALGLAVMLAAAVVTVVVPMGRRRRWRPGRRPVVPGPRTIDPSTRLFDDLPGR